MGEKTYLGDGVYVSFDGYQLKLTTENGIEVTNEIYLEPSVYNSLVGYVGRLQLSTSEKEQINVTE